MLEEAGVAATTGLDFDRQGGRRTMRLSFAGSHEDMREAVARLGNWLR
jgi:aspartate/methionine/tyrosine aminotransferase